MWLGHSTIGNNFNCSPVYCCFLLMRTGDTCLGLSVSSPAQNPGWPGSRHCSVSPLPGKLLCRCWGHSPRLQNFHSNPLRKEFHLYLPNTLFYVSTQNFSLKPHIIASHLTDHPHRYTYCHFCGKSVCQKTLIALYVRTLNCNKFMYAAAPLLENKFYLLINWCFFLVSTKTKIYTRGSEP